MKKYRIENLLLCVVASISLLTPAAFAAEPAQVAQVICRQSELHRSGGNHNLGQLFARTELFFGKSKSDGSIVSDEEFHRFLDEEITPRFPNGLTLVPGVGQFQGSSGTITRENSVLLILLYSADEAKNDEKIERVRERYKQMFQQESVLRVDSQNCVSF